MVSKVESVDPKVPKQAEAKRDGEINPQNYNFNQFYTENFDALNRYELYYAILCQEIQPDVARALTVGFILALYHNK